LDSKNDDEKDSSKEEVVVDNKTVSMPMKFINKISSS
jgi:hypothetical protein